MLVMEHFLHETTKGGKYKKCGMAFKLLILFLEKHVLMALI